MVPEIDHERNKETKGSKYFPFWSLVGFCFQLQWDNKSVTQVLPYIWNLDKL